MGMKVLFYQKGVGFRATATLKGVSEAVRSDWPFSDEGSSMFPIRLDLEEVEEFKEPVNMKALVDRLEFVTDKQHWGRSVQNTPRVISSRDFAIIERQSHN